ncbi:hypothetical protein [Burkholderia sp. Ac-20353]|uniref:hypothetical protein n=1 Tax=Burkholderia sp. Ac-20353 TaxID=2703894 RepID=UPI00197B743F|nr:hypothetical protein [Burkholderia sp. Ac-20353]MBN3791868.1 hypothetical protein [Burkholderia sp. Ac-20353]
MTSRSKSAQAREARERGELTFVAVCIHHGEQMHYASTRACLLCQSERNAPKNAAAAERYRSDPEYRAHVRENAVIALSKRREDPAYRKAERAYARDQRAQRFASSADFRGRKRESVAAIDWRKKTGGNMTGWYVLEREALQRLYGTCPEGYEIDHAVPKIAKDSLGKRVASGLHCFANTLVMPRVVNGMKRNQFNPDTNRAQRPANRFPDGAFDPEPTEHEWSLIRQNAEMGTPEAESLRTLRESLDAKAREYEQHVTALLACIGA